MGCSTLKSWQASIKCSFEQPVYLNCLFLCNCNSNKNMHATGAVRGLCGAERGPGGAVRGLRTSKWYFVFFDHANICTRIYTWNLCPMSRYYKKVSTVFLFKSILLAFASNIWLEHFLRLAPYADHWRRMVTDWRRTGNAKWRFISTLPHPLFHIFVFKKYLRI